MTKEIKLTQGQVTVVDDWRFEELNQYKWFAAWSPEIKSFYAVRKSKTLFGKRTTIFMHSIVAKTPKGFYTDHINHDTLYNLESNLRICNNSQNQRNRGKDTDNTSGYKGVVRRGRKWQAQITVNGKWSNLGTYFTPEEAAHAYDEASNILHGEYAFTNFQD